jgi:hypothetical protein
MKIKYTSMSLPLIVYQVLQIRAHFRAIFIYILKVQLMECFSS